MQPQPLQPSPPAVVLALVEAADALGGIPRHQLAGLLEALGSTGSLTSPVPSGLEPVDRETLDRLRVALAGSGPGRWEREMDRLRAEHPQVGLVTVLDGESYPPNLRRAPDKPPFLFYRGALGAAGERAIAVVGTRRPSPEGVDRARRMARGLAGAGTVVVSGLAAGVDATAHSAALDEGGRTVAVLGHGILPPLHPPGNRALGERIVEADGALVSQFWPDQHPTRATFPMRNVTSSGLALGTVVVEAGERSGARQQARRCMEHGRQLFLCRELVADQEWARRYAGRPDVVVVDDVTGVLCRIDALLPPDEPVQLAFG